jgi:hypothetical protein
VGVNTLVLGLSASAYGFGAGIFFLAYSVFEVPSNLLLAHFGARRWIARIMFTWGITSGAMALIGGEAGFYVVRSCWARQKPVSRSGLDVDFCSESGRLSGRIFIFTAGFALLRSM